MKIVDPEIEKDFTPFGMTIVFETKEETINFYNIFNHTYILDAFNARVKGNQIRDYMESKFPEILDKYGKNFNASSDILEEHYINLRK